jgi:hypothetical protein
MCEYERTEDARMLRSCRGKSHTVMGCQEDSTMGCKGKNMQDL